MRKLWQIVLSVLVTLICSFSFIACGESESATTGKSFTSGVKAEAVTVGGSSATWTGEGTSFSSDYLYVIDKTLEHQALTYEFEVNIPVGTGGTTAGSYAANQVLYSGYSEKISTANRQFLDIEIMAKYTNRVRVMYTTTTGTSANKAIDATIGGSAVNLMDGTWKHIAVVFAPNAEDGNNYYYYLYVNGQLAGSVSLATKTLAISGAGTQDHMFGTLYGRGGTKTLSPLLGQMRSAAFFSTAKDANAILSDYTNGVSSDAENLVGLWNMDTQTKVISDLSGNGYHANRYCNDISTAYATKEDVPLSSHSFTYTYNNDATCAKDGTKSATCANCVRVSTVTDEEHPATGEHTYVEDQNAEGAFVSEANCVSGAIYKKSCEVCGALHATETFTVGTASGHNYSVEDATKEGATVSATTCCDDGVYIKSCAGCGEVDTDTTNTFTVSATGEHTFATGDNGTVNGTRLTKHCTTGDKDIYSAIEGDGMTFDVEGNSVWFMDKKILGAVLTIETDIKLPAGLTTADLKYNNTKTLISGYLAGSSKTFYDLTFTGANLRFMLSVDGTAVTGTVALKKDGVACTNWLDVLADGQWHTVGAVITSTTTMSVYVDGELNNTGTLASGKSFNLDGLSNADAHNYVLGSCVGRTNASSGTSLNVFPGQMRSMAIFSDVRDANEIKADYLTGVVPTEAGLVALFNMNGQTDGIIEDLTSNGYTIYKTCYSKTNKDTSVADMADNHTFGEYVYNNDVTCGDDGTKTGTCVNCARTNTLTDEEHLATGNHTVTSYTYNDDATCVDGGTKTGTCSVCFDPVTIADEEHPATGVHNYVEQIIDSAIKTPGTCLVATVYYKSCSVCNANHAEDDFEGEVAGHNFTKEDVTVSGACVSEETCGEEGTYIHSCVDCGLLDTDTTNVFTVPATEEHIFATGDAGVVNGTRVTKTCTVCENSVDRAVEGDGMTFEGNKFSDTSVDLAHVYIMDEQFDNSYASDKVTFEFTIKRDTPITDSSVESIISGYQYVKGNTNPYYVGLHLNKSGFRLNMTGGGNTAVTVLKEVAGGDPVTDVTLICDGEWHAIALVIDSDAKTVKLYIDGVLNNTVTLKVASDVATSGKGKASKMFGDDASEHAIGSEYGGRNGETSSMNPFGGAIRSFALFNDLRTAEEVAEDAKKGIVKNEENLVALWDMTTPSDGIIEDLTGHGNTVYKTCYIKAQADASPEAMQDNHVSTATFTYNNDATCGVDGTESAKCDYCARIVTRTKAGTATGAHVYTNYIHDENSETCSSYGTATAECDNCDTGAKDTKDETAGTYGEHDYSAWETDGDQHWKECSACGTDDTTYVKENHTFDNACDTECNGGCGYTRTINHDYSVWENSETEHWKKCSICSTIDEESREFHDFDNACDTECNDGCGYTRTTQHIYKNVVNADYLVSGANCEDDAVYKKSCMYCGEAHATETFVDEGSALTHEYENYVYNNDATCTANGTETAECENDCGETDTRIKPNTATGHAYADTHTCHDRACVNECGHIAEATTAHTWNEGEQTTAPTVDAKGEKTYTCTVCGETKTEEIDKLPAPAKEGCSKESVALALATFATLIACAFVIKK